MKLRIFVKWILSRIIYEVQHLQNVNLIDYKLQYNVFK